MSLILKDLTLHAGARPSPYCWRTKYALAHKGLTFTTDPVGFTDIPKLFDGTFKTVPILQDGERVVGDSWAIADYLDAHYADRPKLFATPVERALCRFVDTWGFVSLIAPLFPLVALDLHDAARPEDRAYFRANREQRLGRTLEQAAHGREHKLAAVSDGLAGLRLLLKRPPTQPFLSGEQPGFADFIAVSPLLWVASVVALPLLAADDPVTGWYERLLDAYSGLGRSAPLHSLVK